MSYIEFPFLQELNLQKLQNSINEASESDITMAKILYQYSEKFLMTPDYWLHLITLLETITTEWETLHSCRVLALSHFYSTIYGNKDDKHIEWDGYDLIIAKCQTYDIYPEGIAILEDALTFPHHELEMCYNAYETLSARPISKDLQAKFDQALKLFDILKTSNFDDEWFEALMAINNHEIIVINFEYFLGLNYSCQILWKKYISYMKAKNSVAALNIFRRYVRFFIGDIKMLDSYRDEIEKLSMIEDVTDFWVDTIEFELNNCGLKHAEELFDRAILATMKRDFKGHKHEKEIISYCHGFKAQRWLYPSSIGKNCDEAADEFKDAVNKWKEMAAKKYPPKASSVQPPPVPQVAATPSRPSTLFNPTTASNQAFSLPFSFIYQILKSALPPTLIKLFQSCKSLFKLHSTPLCYQLGVNDEVRPQYFQQSLFLPVSHITFPGLDRLHIVNSLDWIVETDRKALSKVIPKLHKCSAKYIHISSQDLTVDEFKFITANMRVMHLHKTNIFDRNGKALSDKEIEDLAGGIVTFENTDR